MAGPGKQGKDVPESCRAPEARWRARPLTRPALYAGAALMLVVAFGGYWRLTSSRPTSMAPGIEVVESSPPRAEPPREVRPKPGPPRRDPRDEIKAVLNDYVRAMETKNEVLLRRVYPGIPDEDLQRLRRLFEVVRSLKIDLGKYNVNLTEDQAQVNGRRQDSVVMVDGQRPSPTEYRFTFRLKRTSSGWVIQEVSRS